MNRIAFWLIPISTWIGLLSIAGCQDEPVAKQRNGQPASSINVPAPGVKAPTDTVERYGRQRIFYAQVDKAGDCFRRMFVEPAVAAQVGQNGELPDGAVLLMETWFGEDQSTVFIRQKRSGQWLSSSFSPTAPNFTVALETSCNTCHARTLATDLTSRGRCSDAPFNVEPFSVLSAVNQVSRPVTYLFIREINSNQS